jgi:hypothetical protein
MTAVSSGSSSSELTGGDDIASVSWFNFLIGGVDTASVSSFICLT